MDYSGTQKSFFVVLWRQKWVVCVGMVALVVLLVATVPNTYRASSSLVLLNPPQPTEEQLESEDPQFRNTWVQFGDLSIITDILQRVLAGDTVTQDLRARGLEGRYTVTTNADFDRGPVISLAAEAGDPETPLASIAMLQDELDKQLADMQARQGTDPKFFITSDVVVPAVQATRVLSGMLRRMILLGGLGVVLVLGSAAAAEALTSRRRRAHATDASSPTYERGEHLRSA